VNYILSKEAEADLMRIYKFGVYRFGAVQSEKYFLTFFEQFELIVKNPYLFQKVDEIKKEYRRCVCGVHSIYYRVKGKTVEIIRIIGRQDY